MTSTLEPLPKLVAAWKSGPDPERPFDGLFRHCHDNIFRSFPRRVPLEIRRELTQEVFLRVYRHRESCPVAGFERWLYRIARNVYLSWVERRMRLKRRGLEIPLPSGSEGEEGGRLAMVPEPLQSPPTAVDALLHEERRRSLRRAIEALPPQMRLCMLLRVVEGRSLREIADRLGLALGSVKSHLHHAREKLRERLSEEFRDVGFNVDGGEP